MTSHRKCVLRVAGVPLLFFGLIYPHRHEIKSMLGALDHEISQGKKSTSTIDELTRRKSVASRQPLFVAQARHLNWLVKKIERYRPDAWWASILLILLRLAQSSVLVLVKLQAVQAALASCAALFGVIVLREFTPYRRPSDTATAVLAQCVIFSWSFQIVLRSVGAIAHVPTALVGSFLVLFTTSVFVHAWWRASIELREDKARSRTESQGVLSSITSAENSTFFDDCALSSPDAVEAGPVVQATDDDTERTGQVAAAQNDRQAGWRPGLLLCAVDSSVAGDDLAAELKQALLTIEKKENIIAENSSIIKEKDLKIKEKDLKIKEKDSEIERLQSGEMASSRRKRSTFWLE